MSPVTPSDARPTIYDVASRAGVSKSLVSLVLRGSPHVSEPRRLAVQAAIEELGYRPSRAASALAGSRTRSVGVVIDDFTNPWFVDLLRGLRSVLDPEGFHVTVADLQLDAASGRNPVDGFLAMHAEGLVLAAEPEPALLERRSIPTVIAGSRDLPLKGADVVATDDVLGARLAVQHLIGLGHRHIGHLTGRGGSAALRLDGYRQAIKEAGLSPAVTGNDGGTTEEAGYAAAVALLKRHPDLTAVFAANDTMALGALAALRERGRAVPADVSLVGYDNTPLAEARYLSLTSVDNHSDQVGVDAARTLLARIEDPEREPQRILREPSLVVRTSTAAVSPPAVDSVATGRYDE